MSMGEDISGGEDLVYRHIELVPRNKVLRLFDTEGGEVLADSEYAIMEALIKAQGKEVPRARLEPLVARVSRNSSGKDILHMPLVNLRRKLEIVTSGRMIISRVG